jgi:ribonuclease R
MELKLDEEGKVVGAEPEDTSFTHTLIEMFMVEANEAVARLLDHSDVPFLRRTHPEPEPAGAERLRHFVEVAGYKLPKDMNRKALQSLLSTIKGKPESFAINLAVLKSLTRAEYSPEKIGHYALASEHYCHFTSPIRRYADLTIHRLLDAYFAARQAATGALPPAAAREEKSRSRKSRKPRETESAGAPKPRPRRLTLENIPSFADLVTLGKHISFTERRAADAERELRQVKVLELLKKHLGEEFGGVVTGITNFGIFVQISQYLIDGLIRYEDLGDDWWSVDERAGKVTGQRTGTRIGIGDEVKVVITNVDIPRRELNLVIRELRGKRSDAVKTIPGKRDKHARHDQGADHRGHRKGKRPHTPKTSHRKSSPKRPKRRR